MDEHRAAVTALVAAGVRHILYTSNHNANKSIAHVAIDHFATENFIRQSTVDSYTILRNGTDFENDLGTIAGAKHTGKWYSAAKDGKMAALSCDDIALANATALASDNYDNTIFDFSNNVSLTIEEIAAQVGMALGKPIEVVHVSEEGLAQAIATATGMPQAIAQIYATFDTNTAAGFSGPGPNDFKKLTGRDPTTLAEWLESIKPVLAML